MTMSQRETPWPATLAGGAARQRPNQLQPSLLEKTPRQRLGKAGQQSKHQMAGSSRYKHERTYAESHDSAQHPERQRSDCGRNEWIGAFQPAPGYDVQPHICAHAADRVAVVNKLEGKAYYTCSL